MRACSFRSQFFSLALAVGASSLAINAYPAAAQENRPRSAAAQEWNYDEIKKTPEKARLMRNPLENDPDAALAGGKLFERSCAECHGLKAEGGKRAPSLLRDEVRQATPGSVFWILSNGVVWHGMPDWSKLPEPQRWQIVTFLRSFNAPAKPEGPGAS